MTIYIDPEYVTRLEEEKTILNHKLSVQLSENTRLRTKNKELKKELFNAYLHQQHQQRLIEELKLALSSYYNFVDEWFPD